MGLGVFFEEGIGAIGVGLAEDGLVDLEEFRELGVLGIGVDEVVEVDGVSAADGMGKKAIEGDCGEGAFGVGLNHIFIGLGGIFLCGELHFDGGGGV